MNREVKLILNTLFSKFNLYGGIVTGYYMYYVYRKDGTYIIDILCAQVWIIMNAFLWTLRSSEI